MLDKVGQQWTPVDRVGVISHGLGLMAMDASGQGRSLWQRMDLSGYNLYQKECYGNARTSMDCHGP